MFLPALQTDPAEVALALGAPHVVASLVLLDGRGARRARLRVLHQPQEVRSFVRLVGRQSYLKEGVRF